MVSNSVPLKEVSKSRVRDLAYTDIPLASFTRHTKHAIQGDQHISQVWLAERCHLTADGAYLDTVIGNKKKEYIIYLLLCQK